MNYKEARTSAGGRILTALSVPYVVVMFYPFVALCWARYHFDNLRARLRR